MKDACRQTDILGLWQNACEDYYIRRYCNDLSATCRLISLEPWRSKNPWSAALAGKKVLVVHPFEESIQDQYKHFDKLFPGTDILPEFELKTLKAVQTAGSAVDPRFSTWFDALDYMCGECEKLTLTSPCLAVVPTAIRWPPTSKNGQTGDPSRWLSADIVWFKRKTLG